MKSQNNIKCQGGKPDPLISVTLPVYNAEKYLAEAIDSILVQTFSDFELIIIDDGSTDGSLKILKSYEQRDARIRLISRENRNLVATLNEIIDLACGKWIARMDADDIALPHRFERQLQWLEQTEADICGSWIKPFGTRDTRIRKHPVSDEAIKIGLLFGSLLAHPSVVMKTDIARMLRYDPSYNKAEDYELWSRAALSGRKMTNVPEVLLFYRMHETQISTISSTTQSLLTSKIRKNYWLNFYKHLNLELDAVNELLSVSECYNKNADMKLIDTVFSSILSKSQNDLVYIVLQFASVVYLRSSYDCADIVRRWNSLTLNYRSFFTFKVLITIWLFKLFRITPYGFFWNFTKKANKLSKKLFISGR